MAYDSWMNARKVAVMGAGTMGSGIAAHLANLGFEVTLFDLTRDSAQAGFDRAVRIKPPHFFGPDSIARVRLASISNDLELVREADWVCEAIIEKMDAKRGLYAAIEPLLREDAMISTNTSGLEISLLAEGRSESFSKRFLGTHFFNPPRYLKLIELIPTGSTDKDAVSAFTRFLEDRAGRRVVLAKDTPGFIANRYGMWALFQAIHTAERLKFSVETVDAITGPFIGRPRTGTFRLADLIGMDIMVDIAGNLIERCGHDPRMDTLKTPDSVANLINAGWIGSKAGQGYFKKEGDQFLSLDMVGMAYRPRIEPDIPGLASVGKMPLGERIRTKLKDVDEVGYFLREHFVPCLLYAAEIGQEISYSVRDFDEVMKWGWGWQAGPFEMIDAIGYETLREYSGNVPLSEAAPFYKGGTALDLTSLKHKATPTDKRFVKVSDFAEISAGESWKLHEDREGGFIFAFDTKMNAINPAIVDALAGHLRSHPDAKLTLANDGPSFSAGFDLKTFLQMADAAQWDEMRAILLNLQECGALLRKSNSAAAIHGFTLGGGLELAMHCRMVVANPEGTVGLPETLVGVVPAGGGTTLLRMRAQDNINTLCGAAMAIALGKKAPGYDAFKLHYLRDTDALAVNPDQLVHEGINVSRPEATEAEWLPAPPPLAGMIDGEIEKLRASGELAEYGAILASEIKHLFVKPQSEQESLEMEIEVFLRCMGRPRTITRMKHMLESGKPFNN